MAGGVGVSNGPLEGERGGKGAEEQKTPTLLLLHGFMGSKVRRGLAGKSGGLVVLSLSCTKADFFGRVVRAIFFSGAEGLRSGKKLKTLLLHSLGRPGGEQGAAVGGGEMKK